MKTTSKASKGFTLIELMVTIALAAILMLIAIPSFTSFQRNAELTSVTNTLLAGINAARGEAMKRGRYAMVVPNDGVNWSSGWIVFVDVDRSGTHNSGDIDILVSEAAPSYLTISGNNTAGESAPYIMFDASGYSAKKAGSVSLKNLTLSITRNDVAASQTAEQTRRLVISITGRARTCKPSTDSTCSSSAAQ